MGYSEGRFRQVNVALASAGSGLNLTWEYWIGAAWAPLTVTDGTANMTQAGTVTFFPPADWAPTKVNTDAYGYYYVRLRTSSVTIAPVESTILAEDFNPYNGGKYQLRGWDPRNDANEDGFVSDAEYAGLVNPNATARFAYQARPVYGESPYYLGVRWWWAPDNNYIKAWNTYWIGCAMSYSAGKDAGVMEDNSVIYPTEIARNYVEYTKSEPALTRAAWFWDIEQFEANSRRSKKAPQALKAIDAILAGY